MPERRKHIAAIKPPEPKFIREYKEKKGYKEPSKLEDKYIVDLDETKEALMKDDELPVVMAFGEEVPYNDTIAQLLGHDINKKPKFNKPTTQNSARNSGCIKAKDEKANPKKRADMNKLSFSYDD